MAALDNDDDFDWEAAVREIDNACEIASTNPNTFKTPEVVAIPKPNPNPNLKRKQSTLDRFVDSFTKRRNEIGSSRKDCNFKKPDNYCTGVDNPGAEGGESEVKIDMDAAQTWIYPDNVSRRDYQFSIAKVALFSNTLVAVPTGLGKTLIAAVVMYNYFRWFPEGKIVFAAPSRPLVIQQIEACHNIVGVPQDWTIDMTGLMTPIERTGFWTSKRVFFVTPQVLEKDIQSGICPVKQIVCLVIDEAHRASGDYAYCVVVRELMAVPVHLRILALTATPGSKPQAVQNVIDNLCISTLEYRDENDSDVSKYVHKRSLEVIEVELGKDATNINSLLLEIIRPFATELYSYGLLYYRDIATYSPCEMLTSRDKFREAPPSSFNAAKTKEVDAQFGLLISLYYIRKLLSSHGIRPAHEMLAEKMPTWPFRKFLSKNETLMQAKMLMEQSISRGTPNPKLVKLIQILADHFKVKDPMVSRVIIFSNFRESVKDIMGSLATMGDLVKAAEFIGQSSGRASKGQTQKVQQAVLQKFRSGGYNVIVATCIGEEGLDIIEVDLVICFDANISPLRMIQRMGRTGRKNDGRVVILACEGSEIKAYRGKQASSKSIIKHMNNGGIKSFNFHSSPRMVPHVCKPEAKFVEFSIEQFVPRGKKVKNHSMQKSSVSKELSDDDKNVIKKYFGLANEDTWKPSLIAFPSFQTFPSRVYELKHSFRTTSMLIDAMQSLQLEKLDSMKIEASNHSPEVVTIDAVDNDKQDIHNTETTFQETFTTIEENSSMKAPNTGCNIHKLSSHCFLYGEDYVTINSLGHVLITSAPSLPNKKNAVSKALPSESSKKTLSEKINDDEEIFVLDTPISKQKKTYPEMSKNEISMELSPRLTNFIEEGIVPESPMVNHNNALSPHFTPAHQKCASLTTTQLNGVDIRRDILCPLKEASLASPNIMKFSDVSPENFARRDKCESKIKRNIVFSPNIEDAHTPLVNSINNTSENWQPNYEEASKLSQPPPKYKRLRKFGDLAKKNPYQTPKLIELNKAKREKKKKSGRFNSFIDEEAEVSQDAKFSEDEEFGEREDESQYEDSFIDDRQQHSEASPACTGAETVDMMAIYRRSLLTQSPIPYMPNNPLTTPHQSTLSKSSEKEDSNSTGKPPNPLQTPQSASYSDTDKTSITSFNKPDTRKRKLSYHQISSITPIKLPLQDIPEAEDPNKPLPDDDLAECYEDDFFDRIDLDAIEEEATRQLRNKSSSNQGKDLDMCLPTFDLGI